MNVPCIFSQSVPKILHRCINPTYNAYRHKIETLKGIIPLPDRLSWIKGTAVFVHWRKNRQINVAHLQLKIFYTPDHPISIPIEATKKTAQRPSFVLTFYTVI
jgi:hypothetical protein